MDFNVEFEETNQSFDTKFENTQVVEYGEGGKIDSISVNGEIQAIDENKNVDITVPTTTEDLKNDSGFITNEYINEKFMTLTQAEYDELETKDPSVYYFIKEEEV